MARSGRFGRLPAEAQDLSATIASMISQYENQRDRNVEFAWNHGGKFEGQKVTDKFFLGWWQKRRSEVSDDDPMADYYDQMIFNYKFQIREQKVTLAYTQGKIKELGVARFYVEEAGKVPRNSAIWRDLMTNAARFKKAAAKSRNAGNAQSKFEQFQNQWNNIDESYIKPATTVEQVVEAILQSADVGSRSQWSQAMGSGEMSIMEDFFSKVERDPMYADQWKNVWEPALRKADPHHFRGNLSSEYLSGVYGRAQTGAKKQSKLADRRGYSDWKRSADNSASQWGGRKQTHRRTDLATDVEQVWQDALDAGLNDLSKTPDERMAIRATALKELGILQRRAQRGGADVLSGDITRDMRILRGDKGAANRSGTSTATSGDVGEIPDSSGNKPQSRGGSGFDTDQAAAAKRDQDSQEGLLDGSMVIWEHMGDDGVVVKDVVPREQMPSGAGVAIEVVHAKGTSFTGADGKEVKTGAGAVTVFRTGEQIVVQVADREQPTNLPIPTGAEADAQTTSGTVGYRFRRSDGTYQYQLYQDDGTVVWTEAPSGGNGSDLVNSDDIISSNSDGKTLTILVSADLGAGGTLETVPDPDHPGETIVVGRPRNALTDEVRLGKQGAAEKAARERQGEIAVTEATTPSGFTRGSTGGARQITGLDTSKWSDEERTAFAALSPENQRYLIDQGIVGSPSGKPGDRGFGRMKPEEITNERINDAKDHGNAPARWFGGKEGTQPTDAPIPPMPAGMEAIGVTEKQWQTMVRDARNGKDMNDSIQSTLTPEQRRRVAGGAQDAQVALGTLRNGLNTERKATNQEETQPRGNDFVDPKTKIDTLSREIKGLEDQLKTGKDPSGNSLPQGRIDEMRTSIQTMRQEQVRTALGSRTMVTSVVGQGAALVESVGETLHKYLGRNGLTDGTNPVVQEQDDTYTSYTTLIGARDKAHRMAQSSMEPIDILNQLMLADRSLTTPEGRQTLDVIYSEIMTIRRNASADNAAMTKDRLEQDGVPTDVADAATGGRGGGKGARGKGGRRSTGDAMQDSIYAQDESLIRDPAFIFEDDDEDTPVGPFIWGGGKGDPTQWGGLAQFSIANRGRGGGPTDGAAGASDRPVMKLPTLFGMTNFGSITAEQAERERLRANAEKVQASRVLYDPQTRKPVPAAQGSRLNPEPNVRTPKPPEDETKPPPPPKGGVGDTTTRKGRKATVIASGIGAAAGGIKTTSTSPFGSGGAYGSNWGR